MKFPTEGKFHDLQAGVVDLASSLVPRPPPSAFVVACSTKSGGKAWKDLSCDACC